MSTLAGDFWVCGDCRSINNAGARQCYNCRTPRDRAAVDPQTIDPSSHGPLRTIELPAFKSSRWAAMLATVLILAVAVMQVVQFNLAAQLVNQVFDGTPATDEQLLFVGSVAIVAFGIGLLALIAWALWLSRTVRSMPALGLGYPPTDGLMAFVENFIPILNLYRVPAIVRDVVRRLEPKADDQTMTRGEALVFAAWIGLIGGFFIPRVLAFLNRDERALIPISGIGTGFVLVGAIFLVILIWWIEGKVAQRREAQLAGTAPSAAAAPSLETRSDVAAPLADSAIAASALEAAAQRSAFAALASAGDSGPQSFRLPPTEDVPTATTDSIETPEAVLPAEPVATETGAPLETEPAVTATEPPSPDPGLSSDAAPPPEPGLAAAPDPAPAEAAPSTEAALPTEAPAPPVAATARPPDLTIRISSRGMLTAELDGEVEHVMLDDLTPYGEALSHVGGTATIHVPTDEGMPALIAKRAQRILEDAGVPVTLA